MKKIFLFLVISSCFSIILNAQKKNIIKTSLIFPLAESFDISYERILNDEMSLVIEGIIGSEFGAISPQFRYYLSEKNIAPTGAFVSPFGMIGSDGMTGGGVMVGYQRLFKEKLSLDAYIGPGIYVEAIAVWGGINLGFAF